MYINVVYLNVRQLLRNTGYNLCFGYVLTCIRQSYNFNETPKITLQLFVGGLISYLRYLYLYLFVHSGFQHILCCVFALFVFVLCLVYHMLPVSLDCPFLIAPSVFPSVYLKADQIIVFTKQEQRYLVLEMTLVNEISSKKKTVITMFIPFKKTGLKIPKG